MTPAHASAFSIATPTRNALAQLRRCIGSVRGQAGIAYEHLVQDAASEDDSPRWLKEQARDDSRLSPISERDAGMYDAINRAWSRSTGRYLAWLNADEQYLPGTLARVGEYFDAHPKVDVLSGDYLVVDSDGLAVALRRELPMRRFYVVNGFLNTLSCALFYRRRLLDQGLLTLDSRLRYAADKDLVLRLAESGARFAHLPELLSVFGVDGCNLSTHPAMHQEAELVRRAHGASRWPLIRWCALAARRGERLLKGAYRSCDLSYKFALDEVPRYAVFHAKKLGGRYDLAHPHGSAIRIDVGAEMAATREV